MFDGMSLEMPYFDRTTGTILFFDTAPDYPVEAGWFTNFNQTYNDFDGQMVKFSWLNKANPDWSNLYDLTSAQVFSSITDFKYFVTTQHINSAFVTVSPPLSPANNYWWGTSSFAKYGIFCWGGITAINPVQFINFEDCGFASDNIQYNGFGAGGFNGQTLSVTTYTRLPLTPVVGDGMQFPYPT
jgi:hypothetical protein